MRHEASWFSPLIWLSMLGLAFVCGLVVMGQAFETRVFMFDDRSLRVSADYSAELRLAQAAPIAPVDSAVISDTVRDLIAEQEQAPLLSLFLSTPTIVAEPRPSRTATPVAVRLPPATPGPTSAIVLLPVGPGPTSPNPPVSSPGPAIDPNPHGPRATRVPTHTPTHVPTRTPLPTATPRPSNTATPRPTHTATPWPTSVPPTETPTELPPPPTETPTEVGVPPSA